MRERRFLVTETFSLGSQVRIVGAEAHHLLNVLRLREGDAIVIFNGKGRAHTAVITDRDRQSATAQVKEVFPSRESPLELTVALAIPKGDKMSGIVRMLTELGANKVVPLTSHRSTSKNATEARDRVTRWERVALEACKQSGRSVLPSIDTPLSFDELLDLELPKDRFLLCPEGEDLPRTIKDNSCLAAIGPEGGWSQSEIKKASSRGFFRLGLGPRILRVETAAAAATTLLQWRYGDLTG